MAKGRREKRWQFGFFFARYDHRVSQKNENEGLLSMITFWTFGTVAERAPWLVVVLLSCYLGSCMLAE